MNIKVIASVSALVVVALGVGWFFTPAANVARAEASMKNFINSNNVQVERAACSHDSDGDGYASCSLKPINGEVVLLQCTSGIFNSLPIIGAKVCKEQGNQIIKLR